MLEFFALIRIWMLVFVMAVFSSGCAASSARQVTFVDGRENRVVAAAALVEARKIAILPFLAGEGAEAGAETDQVALMIVKGIAESLGEGGLLEIISPEDAMSADVLLKGRIEQKSRTGKIKKLVTFSQTQTLRISAQLVERDTQAVLLVFDKERRDKNIDFKQQGYLLGQELGAVINGARN